MQQTLDFETMREEFSSADLDRKVQMYVNAQGLTQEQYKDLLKLFPTDQLSRLEYALQ